MTQPTTNDTTGPRRARSLCVALVITAIALAGCGGPPPAEPAPPPREPAAVTIAKVETVPARRVVRSTGSFRADDEMVVSAEVAGRLVSVGPEEGDVIAPGAVLATVDDAEYALARAEHAAALAESLAKIGLSELPANDPDFAALPSVERTRIEESNAKAKLDRARALHERTPPLISDQDFADLVAAHEVASSMHRAALLAARAELAEARTRKAQLDTADKALRDTVHVAPRIAGDAPSPRWIVAERRVSAGSRVSVGSPLYRLVDADPLRLRVRVPERKMTGVIVGRPASVTTATSKTPLAGTVSRIRAEIDPKTRTFDVEIAVANPGLAPVVGAFGIAEIDVGEDLGVPVVPEKAVVSFAGVKKVFVPGKDKDAGKAAERLVVTGRKLPGGIEIVEGLRAGDAIVTDPPPGLVAGAPIRASTGESAPAGDRK